MPTLTTSLTRADADLNYAGVYSTVLLIPRAAVTELLRREENANRIICEINGQGQIFSGLMPDGQGDFFITISKAVRDRFGLTEGESVELAIRPDHSTYGIPLPAEAAELWAMDSDAHEVFHRLSPGKQRSLLYLIDKLKRPESRAKKAVQIHEYLKSVDGQLDYREMNEYIKADNRGG